MKIQIHPRGTRIGIRRGRFPIDPAQVGRSGTIVRHLPGGQRYGVQLDGDRSITIFAEDELEALASEPAGTPGTPPPPGTTGRGPG